MMKENFLTGDRIKQLVFAKLDEYEKLNVNEKYAMFMGKSQILELGLKSLLSRKYGVPLEDMELWTLGKIRNELKDRGLRPDFIKLLKSVVDYRNYMAHEFLVNTLITQLFAKFSNRKLYGDLFRAIYELVVFHSFCKLYLGC